MHPATPSVPDATAQADSATVQPIEEIRFAVVMYGGVSLAIYMNGVAQEMLSMVRATAPAKPGSSEPLLGANDPELRGSAGVYRKLGQYLHEWNAKNRPDGEAIQVPGEQTSAAIRTRFVVDVISGTSAGGINGIFLGKALANSQTLEGLRKLWVSEGDLSKLLNDQDSVTDLKEDGIEVQRPEQSLLNSQRMYRKLLEAFDQMDPTTGQPSGDPPSPVSPLVGELDLFVTTTDIAGLPLPIQLTDKVIYEQRHRNVFHFRYATTATTGDDRNDFVKANDPFLAYAARCTSSFPFAFEPMRLCDIDDLTRNYKEEGHPYRRARDLLEAHAWDHFFSEYLRGTLLAAHATFTGGWTDKDIREFERERELGQEKLREGFRFRAFGDGGYLDNKPFTYATSMLMRRHADVPVQRKLIYVEPAPEHPELLSTDACKPDFIENSKAALLDLPRQETIREDIDRLVDRNAMIRRISEFTANVDGDILALQVESMSREQFERADLHEMIRRHGVSFGAYHRLKVGEISDLLSLLIARAAGHDPDSDVCLAIRAMVEAWRKANYIETRRTQAQNLPNEDVEGGVRERRTENAFLLEFDIRYALRRLIFASRRINHLAQMDRRAESLLRLWWTRVGGSPESDPSRRLADPTWARAFRDELSRLQKILSDIRVRTRSCEERLLRAESTHDPRGELGAVGTRASLAALVSDLGVSWSELYEVLNTPYAMREDAAWKLLQRADRLEALDKLAKFVSESFQRAHGWEIEGPDPALPEGANVARSCIRFYIDNFSYYDLVAYPVQYGTDSGEASHVEIFRISPEDATLLLDERRAGEDRRKLAGTVLFNFGAFIERRWRTNDILWGRLDGADRLITAVFPADTTAEKTLRADLIRDAQAAILAEVLTEEDRETMCKLLSQGLAALSPECAEETRLRKLVEGLLDDETLSGALKAALQACLSAPSKLWDYYHSSFEVDRRADAKNAVRMIARSTAIVGAMLEDAAQRYRGAEAKRTLAWIPLLGRWFWRVVEVAVPQSLGNLFVRHWLGVLYIFDGVIIFGGLLLGDANVKQFGWMLFAVTLGINALVAVLGDLFVGRRVVRWVVLAVVVAAAMAIVYNGIRRLGEMFQAPRSWTEVVSLAVALALGGLLLRLTGNSTRKRRARRA